MFNFDRNAEFIRNLASSRARESAERLSNAGRTFEAVSSSLSLPQSDSTTDAQTSPSPDMTLAESNDSLGSQMENPPGNSSNSTRSSNNIPSNIRDLATQTRSAGSGMQTRLSQDASNQLRRSRETMTRRLGSMQVERVAEMIRDRLESEFKTERERRGREPL